MCVFWNVILYEHDVISNIVYTGISLQFELTASHGCTNGSRSIQKILASQRNTPRAFKGL